MKTSICTCKAFLEHVVVMLRHHHFPLVLHVYHTHGPSLLGADDVHQLQELDEEDFRRLCVAVGMAGKPLHMMRFSRALQRNYHHGNMTKSHPTGPLPAHPASTGKACRDYYGPFPWLIITTNNHHFLS